VIEVDGSFGEGGGQILRTLLTLSALTGRPFRLTNVRSKRPNPGLRKSHLLALNIVASLCDAEVKGSFVGSTEVEFIPRNIKESGEMQADVGTAGSVTLIAQTIIPILLGRNLRVVLRGGTDVPKSPTSDYMKYVFMRVLNRIGIKGELEVSVRGYYPKGGGEIRLSNFSGGDKFSLLSLGAVRRAMVISHVVSLPLEIAEREAKSASEVLSSIFPVETEVKEERGFGKGTATLVYVEGDSLMGADSLGALGKRAEEVGREASASLVRDYFSGGAVDSHMSDMIMVYSAIFGGEYKGSTLTCHARTNAEVIRKFGAEVEIKGSSPFFFRVNRPVTS